MIEDVGGVAVVARDTGDPAQYPHYGQESLLLFGCLAGRGFDLHGDKHADAFANHIGRHCYRFEPDQIGAARVADAVADHAAVIGFALAAVVSQQSRIASGVRQDDVLLNRLLGLAHGE